MKINCENGFYKFYPENSADFNFLKALYGIDLIKNGDYYTFAYLKGLPSYSIEGLKYGDIVALKTYSGKKEDIFLLNNAVYDIKDGVIKNRLLMIEDITAEAWQMDYWAFKGIPQVGAFLKNKRLKSFYGWLDFNTGQLYCVEVLFYE